MKEPKANVKKLSKSGFRFNISKACRWTKERDNLEKFREGFDRIDWSKKK